jgi:hypothetical protein
VLRDVEQHTHAKQIDQERRAAKADQRKRNPLGRHQPEHHADVHHRLRRDHGGQPKRDKRAKRVFGAQGDAQAAPCDDAEAEEDRGRANQSELLADDGIDEVGMRLRQIEQLLHAGHQAAAEDTACADGDKRLNDLETVAKGVGPWIPERQQTSPAVRRRDEHQINRGKRNEGQPDEIAVVQARREHHHRNDEHERDRRPEVGLQQNERDDEADDQADGQQRIGEIVDAMHPPFEHQRREEHACDLRQLGGLNPEAAYPEPSSCAIDRRAEQDRDQHQHHEREKAPDEGLVAICPVVDSRGHDQHRKAERTPECLLRQEEVRLLITLQRHDRRGAVHHDDADANQQQRRSEQHFVDLELTSHSATCTR